MERSAVEHAERLIACMGEKTFPEELELVQRNKRVTRLIAIEIANQFFRRDKTNVVDTESAPVCKPSASRREVFERMLRRHESLARFKLKQEAMSGKSAA